MMTLNHRNGQTIVTFHDVAFILVVSGRNTDLRDIHPLDLHAAVYLCADDFLRQVPITPIDSIDSNI